MRNLGARRLRADGYVELCVGQSRSPLKNKGWMLEHRHVVEEALGRRLLPAEQVHHKNHDKTDNRPENLEIVTPQEHGLVGAIGLVGGDRYRDFILAIWPLLRVRSNGRQPEPNVADIVLVLMEWEKRNA